MKEIKPTLPPAPTTGRQRTSELDGTPDLSPDEPMFMPEEHAVAVSRNEDNPIMAASRMLQAMEKGHVNVAAGYLDSLAEGLERYQAGVSDGFKQLQARLDMAERAHAKFMDDVASALQLCEVPEEQAETPDWVLRELRNYVQMNKPKQEAYAGFSREDLVGFVESMAKEHNVTEITESLKRTPLRAIRTLVDTIAKRKSPTALRHDLHNTTLQIEYLTAALRHIGRGVGACEWALAADDRGAVNDIVKGFDALVGEKQELEAKNTVAEQETRSLLNDCRALVQEFNGGLVDHPLAALRDMLETLTKNQKPDGMDNNVQTVITANARLNATLQAIEAVIQTSKV